MCLLRSVRQLWGRGDEQPSALLRKHAESCPCRRKSTALDCVASVCCCEWTMLAVCHRPGEPP